MSALLLCAVQPLYAGITTAQLRMFMHNAVFFRVWFVAIFALYTSSTHARDVCGVCVTFVFHFTALLISSSNAQQY